MCVFIVTGGMCAHCYSVILLFYIFILVTITNICEASVNENFAMINTVVFHWIFSSTGHNSSIKKVLKVTTY